MRPRFGRVSAREPEGDYVSCGCASVQITWGRLCLLLSSVWLIVLLSQRAFSPPTPEIPAATVAVPQVETVGHTFEHTVEHSTQPQTPRDMPSWCEAPGSEGSLDEMVGHVGRIEVVSTPPDHIECVWKHKTDAQVPFRMCNAPETEDNQISKVIMETGQWHGSTKETLQAALPTIGQSEAEHASSRERLVFLDVGASTGFFSLLAAVRGYDVIAIEPEGRQAARIVLSARSMGLDVFSVDPSIKDSTRSKAIELFKEASARWSQRREDALQREHQLVEKRSKALAVGVTPDTAIVEREGSIAVLRNALSDRPSPVQVQGYPQNPGASYATEHLGWYESAMGATKEDVVRLPGVTDAWAFAGDALPQLGMFKPKEVAAIKISAEGMDSRALDGLRQIVSQGRPPLIVFVFNRAHVKEHGCDPRTLMFLFIDWGYRMYDYGLYRTDKKQIAKVLDNWGDASVTVVLIEKSHRM